MVASFAGVSRSERFEALKIGIVEHLAGRSAADDITIALLDCAAEVRRRELRGLQTTVAQQVIMPSTNAAAGDWELRFRIGAERLRHVDVIPILQEFMSRVDPSCAIDKSTFRVLSELFSNALEHGLLELDSSLKDEENGVASYARERDSRLASLADGHIAVDIARVEGPDGARLKLKVKDSGKGFDSQAWHSDASALFRTGEKGIGLIEQLCESVEYRAGGAEIEVTRLLAPLLAR